LDVNSFYFIHVGMIFEIYNMHDFIFGGTIVIPWQKILIIFKTYGQYNCATVLKK